MNVLQEIFRDHFEEIQYILHPRHIVMETIEKMIHCGDSSYGGAMYGCPHCGKLKFVPFRCHTRFCPSCGNKYSIDRTNSMSFKMIQASHRHCVFTIAEPLRIYFLKDRSLLNCLFSAARSVILRLFHKDNKTESFTPGFICVLHTFGRDLKWNPHIHCLVTEGGLGKSMHWRPKKHFNFTFLRDSFMTALLNEMELRIGPSFKKVKASMYNHHKKGFYVYAKATKCDSHTVVKYIGRYLGRPVISTKRIDYYDGDNVIFHYNRHEDDVLVTEVVPALEFIIRLIRHIPEKHFKMIRYYGLYARHRESDKILRKAISPQKKQWYLSVSKWRQLIAASFGYDPLRCPECGNTMHLLELYHNHQRLSLDELYKKAMSKHKGCRLPSW